jgi:hypothetical protein
LRKGTAEQDTTSSPAANTLRETLLIVPLGDIVFGNSLLEMKDSAISASNPLPHNIDEIGIANPLKEIVENLCLFATEEAIHSNVGDVAGLKIVAEHINTTISTIGTRRTSGNRLYATFANYLLQNIRKENLLVAVLIHIAHLESTIPHSRQHPCFIGRIYITSVVIYDSTYSSS